MAFSVRENCITTCLLGSVSGLECEVATGEVVGLGVWRDSDPERLAPFRSQAFFRGSLSLRWLLSRRISVTFPLRPQFSHL